MGLRVTGMKAIPICVGPGTRPSDFTQLNRRWRVGRDFRSAMLTARSMAKTAGNKMTPKRQLHLPRMKLLAKQAKAGTARITAKLLLRAHDKQCNSTTRRSLSETAARLV